MQAVSWECPLCKKTLERVDAPSHLSECTRDHPRELEELQQDIWRSWLVDRVSLEAFELNYVRTEDQIRKAARDKKDNFWLITPEQWLNLQSALLPGDELWRFTSDQDSWANMAGRLGWAVIRDKKIVGMLVTLLS